MMLSKSFSARRLPGLEDRWMMAGVNTESPVQLAEPKYPGFSFTFFFF